MVSLTIPSTVKSIKPDSVYLIELVNIFSNTWNNLVESPYNVLGIVLSTSAINFIMGEGS